MRIIAHRGASRSAPENTLAAVRLAWERGAHGVEVDVRLSADGVPVVIHDADTRRVAGVDAPVAAQTAAQLQAHALPGGARIPTLAEVAAAVPPGRTLFVEIKSGADTVPAVLAALPDDARFAFQSFEADVLEAISRARSSARLYWTLGTERNADGSRQPLRADAIGHARGRGFHGLAVDHRGLTPAFIAAVREAGLELGVWTVNDAARVAELAALGSIDWLETDVPAVALAALVAR